MPKISEEQRAARRDQITAGARRAFARHGYHDATVGVLEREIGLSRGAIFSYFPTKLELFVALAEEDQRKLLHMWIDHGHEQVMRHIVDEDPEWLAVYLDVARMLRSDGALRARWSELNPDLQAQLEAHVVELSAAGRLRDDLPLDSVGRFLGIVLDGLALQQAAHFGPPIDIESTLALVRSALAPNL